MHNLRIVHLFHYLPSGVIVGAVTQKGPAQGHGVMLEILEVGEGWGWGRFIGGKAIFGGE